MEIYRGEFERTASHWWWRPGWGPGARYLTVHLTFAAAPELRSEAARYVPALAGRENVGVVPEQWLHLTMTGIGFVGVVPSAAVGEITERVLDGVAGLALAPLVLDTFFLGREGVSLTGPLPAWLASLKADQERIVRDVLGEEAAPSGSAFHPHVSLAYFAGEVDEAVIPAAVRGVGMRDVVIRTPTLSVLELGRDDRVYTWRVLAERTLALGA